MVKIKVMVIRYRGTLQAWQLPRGVPIPDAQFFFVGEEGGYFVDGVGFFLNLRLRIEFWSLRSSISCSRLSIYLHSSCLFSCKRRKGINSILGFFTLSGRLDFLNSTCMSPSWGSGTSSSSELVSYFPFWSQSSSSPVVQP